MSSPQGAVAPRSGGQVVQGYIEPGPSSVIDAKSTAAHGFFEVVKHLVRNSGSYHTEDGVLRALDSVEAFRKHSIPNGDHKRVVKETDPAPVEDVRLRTPPAGAGGPAPLPVGPAIDYAQLAAAIIAAQAQHQQEQAQAMEQAKPQAPEGAIPDDGNNPLAQ